MKTSLDHLPESKQQEILAVANILRDVVDELREGKTGRKSRFAIQKIILFGSYARTPKNGKPAWVYDPANGYISDYDILVIVNSMELVEDLKLWDLAQDRIMRRIEKTPVSVIVHTLKEVNDWLYQGRYFFKDIREEGIELYNNDGRELVLPGNLSDEEKHEIAQKHFDQWYRSAEEFQVLYGDTIKHQYLKKAAFLLHQATEHYFSCALLVFTNYLPKTHDIEKLRHFCADIDPRFAEAFPTENKFHRRGFHRLKRAYIEARYSEHYEITVEELNWLAEEVEKLKALVQSVCLAELQPR